MKKLMRAPLELKNNATTTLYLTAAVILCAVSAQAATDATFQEIVDKLIAWLTGSLGMTFSLGALAIGLTIGMIKQSIMGVAVGIGIALACSIGPAVLMGIFTAAL
ncbi:MULTISPECIES: TraA family conjugative transfer protein [Herbaspirillum]|uniref:TraA family conjugative transfer protein n=2 Tax=Herbaspirillum huttiense TaxID=863372 RepID=A0AAJ2LW07_9BURK|nr:MULTISPECIES: TraA family conjugative transfer protein [Herbaspirillum]MDR9837048.1 TraA family conjugative transfer protein [Herbaspirillum huttiense]